MIELRGRHNTLRLSPTVWTMTLELARLSGWQPAGTELGDETEDGEPLVGWLMQYTSSNGQFVSAADAERLSVALDRALSPDNVAIAHRSIQDCDIALHTPPGGFEWFATEAGRAHLRALGRFCGTGPFAVL
ncbi:MAG TPA: hypothetical protein VLI90_17420 [Tepidisphaeraceae bacterium]|nr:hypothetical protein [Tepidisphaeraceae bacterium]